MSTKRLTSLTSVVAIALATLVALLFIGITPTTAAADQSADQILAELEAAAYQCPSYTEYCWRDAQCDNYCGATGAGACEWGCCACTF